MLIIPPPKYRKRSRIKAASAAPPSPPPPPPPAPVVVVSVNVAGDDELWGFVEGVLPGSWNDPTGFATDSGPATSCVGVAGEDHFIIEGPGFGFASDATYNGTGAAAPFILPYDLPPS